MRRSACALVLFTVGCASQGLPLTAATDDLGAADLATTDRAIPDLFTPSDDRSVPLDFAARPDFSAAVDAAPIVDLATADLTHCSEGGCSCPGGGGALDQSHLLSDAKFSIEPGHVLGQTFTVGTSGTLTAIEVGLSSCNNSVASLPVRLSVFNGSGVFLGATDAPVSSIQTTDCIFCDVNTQRAQFDVSAFCIGVTAGDRLSFTLTTPVVGGTCSANTCRGGPVAGAYCRIDEDCAGVFIGACASDLSLPGYSGGTLTADGTPQPEYDLFFQTLVR